MTAQRATMFGFINELRHSLLPQLEKIHPSASGACLGYIEEMHYAPTMGDMTEVKRLMALLQYTIKDELEWEEDKRLSAADPDYVPRCMRAEKENPGTRVIEQTDGRGT
jgi:hypothetical protein